MVVCIEKLERRREQLERSTRRRRLAVGPDAGLASRYVFSVTLRDDDGAEWQAIGGGATVDEALGFALESAPAGRSWRPVRWLELYGD